VTLARLAMNKILIDADEYKELFYVLGLVFVAIRMTDSVEKAKVLADIFHNVPAKIGRGFPLAAILNEINDKAAQHECEQRINAMFNNARKNLAK
jgi:hypothetical protein